MALAKQFRKAVVLSVPVLFFAVPAYCQLPCTSERVRACLDAIDKDKRCPILPLPATMIPASVLSGSFKLDRLRPGVWSYFDGAYRSVIIYKRRRLILIDFPPFGNLPKGGTLLANATMKILDGAVPRRVDMVYSHRHYDHIGGASRYYSFVRTKFPRTRILVWGTRETRKFILRTSSRPIPLPNVIVGKRGRTVHISRELRLKLIIFGGHTNDDLVAYIRPFGRMKGIVHFVDVVSPGSVPFIDFSFTIDLGKYVDVQKRVLRLDFGIYSGGHSRLGERKDVEDNMKYSIDVIQIAKKAESKVTPEQIASSGLLSVSDPKAAEFNNIIFVLKTRSKLVGQICFREIVKKYGCILGSVDVVGRSHCEAAFFFNLIDNGETVQ